MLGNHVDDGLSEHRPEFVGRHAVRICQVDFVAMPRHLGHQAKDQKLGGRQAFRRIFSHWNKTLLGAGHRRHGGVGPLGG